MTDLKNKVAIVTGARRGMGRAHALLLAEAGAKVVVADISQEECEKVVKEIAKSGGEAIAIKCDVTKKEEVRAAIKKAIAIDNVVFIDFHIEPEENVYPMVPAGEAINRMIGGMA